MQDTIEVITPENAFLKFLVWPRTRKISIGEVIVQSLIP
jgi:hypothetical protein